MNKWNSKKRIAVICVLFLCFYIISESCLLIFYNIHTKRLEQEYNQTAQESVNGFTDMLGNLFFSYIHSSNIVFEQKWYHHLRNYSGFYEYEFDMQTRAEIQRSLAHIRNSMWLVKEILVYIPNLDTVICPNGWFSKGKYEQIYSDLDISITSIDTYDTEFISQYPIVVIDDPTIRKYPAYMVYILDVNKIDSMLNELTSDQTVYISVSLTGELVSISGEREDNLRYFSTKHDYPELEVEFGIFPPQMKREQKQLMLYSVVIFFSLVIIACSIIMYTLKPIISLVLANEGTTHDLTTPYYYIYEYINSLKKTHAQLLIDKERMEGDMKRYIDRAREDLLLGMLSSSYFCFYDSEVSFIFPWLNYGFDMCIFIIPSDTVVINDIKSVDSLNMIYEYVEISIDIGRVALVWFKDMIRLDEKQEYSGILRYMWSQQNNSMCFVTDVFSENAMISSYFERLIANLKDGVEIHSALSTSIKNQLYESVQNGDVDGTLSLVKTIKIFYDPKDIVNYLNSTNCMGSMQVDTWENVLGFLESRMAEISEFSEPKESERYVEYIEQNFMNPNLSIVLIADAFGKHRSTISKGIKEMTGLTFTDYLHSVRIAETCKRINMGDNHIIQIAMDVGYSSYSTFKRAFQQYTGQTPAEYKQKVKNSNA